MLQRGKPSRQVCFSLDLNSFYLGDKEPLPDMCRSVFNQSIVRSEHHSSYHKMYHYIVTAI